MSVSSLFKAIEIQDLSVHPDGRKAIASVNRGRNWELATIDLRAGALAKFLTSDQSLLSPLYSDDGERIAYNADFEGNEDYDVFIIRSDGSASPKRLTDGVADNSHPTFSPDGALIAFTSNRKRDMENLYVVKTTGGSLKRLTNEELPVRDFEWSPDGARIAYGTGISDDDYISVVDLASGKSRKVLAKRNVEYGITGDHGGRALQWSRDGRRLMFTSNENDSFDIGELDLRSKKSRWLVRSPNDKYAPRWSPDETMLAYQEVNDPDVVLKVRGGRRARRVSPEDGVTRIPHWLPDGSGMVFANSSSMRPEELFRTTRGSARKITRFMKEPLPSRAFARPRLVRYRSFDGRLISAMLFVSRGGPTGRGVVIPHGGPEMQSVNLWDQIVQMFVIKGFSVILPNYRGSTGYGREFLHLHDGDLGGGDLKDTLHAGTYLVRSGITDEDKLGFWGASYGGFLCMLALTKAPDMWAAGVSVVGFFDWETEFAHERGFLKAYDLKKMGDPVKNRDRYRNHSPIHFLENLRAPLLLTASSRDVRCPPTESRALVEKLRRMGKEHEYHEYTDEGHWPRKRKNLKDLYERSVRFLDRRIPG
ncbi:TPA: S9 family peptidase [Thermoplasmata archaeon]|nr:S9 family peptidase [Thermoplasmata archaeon]